MIQKKFKIIGETGFARIACLIVSYASKCKSNLVLEYKGVSVDLKDSSKSIMGIMSLGIKPGDYFTIITDGSEERHVLQTVETSLSKIHAAKAICSINLTMIKDSRKQCCCG